MAANASAAVGLLRRKSGRGDARATFLLALRAEEGDGTAQDEREAFRLYTLAAERGFADAQGRMGDICVAAMLGQPVDFEAAARWYRLAAEQGHADAQYKLGLCYAERKGVQQDWAEALRWYRLAAEQGSAAAQYSLGWCHAQGEGVQQDIREAVRWYRLAAEQGNAKAQHNLSLCYGQGEGVQQDVREAVRWCRLAAAGGCAHAHITLGGITLQGEGAERDVEEGARLLRRAQELDPNLRDIACDALAAAAGEREVVTQCCITCGRTGRGLKKCERCHVAVFCSREHLRSSWKVHKPHCNAWCAQAAGREASAPSHSAAAAEVAPAV